MAGLGAIRTGLPGPLDQVIAGSDVADTARPAADLMIVPTAGATAWPCPRTATGSS